MKPYYEHGGITIYHGDCREVLPTLPAPDLILTDPPYGISLENHAAGKERRNADYSIIGDKSPIAALWVLKWASALPAAFFASPWRPWPGQWRNLLVWDKGPAVGGGGDTRVCFKRTWELIQIARNGPLRIQRDGSVLSFWVQPQDSQNHVAEKPVGLMSYLVRQLTPAQSMIVDPFAGSGSTLVAAKRCGRLAIGIEIEEKYCEIAAKRLAQEVLAF